MGKIHNKFEFYTQKIGQEAEHVGHAENVVLDRFYKNLAAMLYGFKSSRSDGINFIALGSGTNTPNSSDTGLTTYYNAYTASRKYIGYNAEQDYYEYQYSVTLLPTTAVGQVFTEVGLATDRAANSIVTKALITDNLGNPISITKKETESLIIVATLYISDSQFVDPETRPAIYWMPQWVEEVWKPEDYADWTTKPHQKISDSALNGDSPVEDQYTFSCCPDIFKGLSQISTNTLISSFADVPRYGKSAYTYTTNGQNGSEGDVPTPKRLTLNTDDMNLDYGLTCDIYKTIWSIGGNGAMDMSCVPVGDVLMSNVTIGTGDGIQTEFKIPHEGAKDITCSIEGATIIRNRQSEVVPVYDPHLLWDLRPKYNDGMSQDYVGVKSEWIPYKKGYIKFVGVYGTKLTGIYVYHDADSDHYYCVPERIDMETPIPYKFFACSVSPDHSFIIFKITDSGRNAANLYYMYNYDKTTGKIGAKVYESSRPARFTQDMRYLLNTSNDGKVRVLTFERTANELKTTEVFTFVGCPGYTNPLRLVESGTSYIVDGIVRVYGGSGNPVCHTFKVDFDAQTATLITRDTFDNTNCSANYACTYTNKVLTVYEFSTGSAVPIYTNDYTGTNMAKKDMAFRSIIDTGDRIYITFYKNGVFPQPCNLLILARDSENHWYEVNTQHKNYHFAGDGIYDSCRGVVHQELTVGKYTLVENMLMPASCASGSDGRYVSSQDSLCFKRDKDIRIRFATPPAAGVPVVVGYKLDYLPKDANWIMKVQGVMNVSKAD